MSGDASRPLLVLDEAAGALQNWDVPSMSSMSRRAGAQDGHRAKGRGADCRQAIPDDERRSSDRTCCPGVRQSRYWASTRHALCAVPR